jgi:hypothetical protein
VEFDPAGDCRRALLLERQVTVEEMFEQNVDVQAN